LTLQEFSEQRAQVYERLDGLRDTVDSLLAQIAREGASMTLLARLEGLRAEREDLSEKYRTLEDSLISSLLKRDVSPPV
jgi:hypothetical protein